MVMAYYEHLHCTWCGHTLRHDCRTVVVTNAGDPPRRMCRGSDHDCFAQAQAARETKQRAENTRGLLGL